MSWLDRMRTAPQSTRRWYAFTIALVITGIIFVFWLALWLPDFWNNQNVAAKNATFESPAGNAWSEMGAVWQGITSKTSQAAEMLQNNSWANSATYEAATSSTDLQ